MSTHKLVRLSVVSLFIAGLLLATYGRQPAVTQTPAPPLTAQIPGRDLRADPPVVEELAVKALDDVTGVGNAQLLVQFAREEKLPRQFAVRVEDRVVTLHDDGEGGDDKAQDGIFSAIAPVDFDLIRKNQERLRQQGSAPIFADRQLVGRRSVTEFLTPIKAGAIIKIPPFGIFSAIDSARSLLIRHPSVVQDPTRTRNACNDSSMGKWSFGYLMQQMANQPLTGITPEHFTLRWLNHWKFDQTVNNWGVDKRPDIKTLIIDPWLAASGGVTLDLAKAPFRLLAIVNRVDLRQNFVYGGGSAGEARFVFGAVHPTTCNPLPFTVIFEYGITKNGCFDLKAWAKQWKDLDLHPLGSPAYNDALEDITEQFVAANKAPSKPNGSALNQLRTNEIALDSPWELREFRIFNTDADAHHLRLVTVKQTPDISLNGSSELRDYVNLNAAAIKSQTHVVPLEFPLGSPFVGGSAPTPFGMFWNHAGIPDRQARHMFSLQTCNGCHAGETATTFTHIDPAPFGAFSAGLSGFLTGISIPDRADGAPMRTFNDLLNRADDLEKLLNQPCFFQINDPVLLMQH